MIDRDPVGRRMAVSLVKNWLRLVDADRIPEMIEWHIGKVRRPGTTEQDETDLRDTLTAAYRLLTTKGAK